MKQKSILLCVILLCFSCSKKEKHDVIQANEKIHVSFEYMDKQTNEFVNNIEDVNLIPLDIDSVLIPALPQLRITNENIYLFSVRQQELYIFSRENGSYINKISQFGKGPKEYVNAVNYSLTRNSDIIIYDAGQGKYLRFDKNGIFNKEININSPTTNLAYLTDSSFIGFSRNTFKSGADSKALSIFDINGNKKKSFLQLPSFLNESSMNPVSGTFFSYKGLEPSFMIPFHNYIYAILPDTISCNYYIDFGKHSVPEHFYENHKQELESDLMSVFKIMFDRKWAFSIEYFQETPSFVFFQFMIDRQVYYALYNKQSKKTLMTKFLSLPPEWVLVVKPFIASDSNGFYTIVEVNQLNLLLKLEGQLVDSRLIKLQKQFKKYSRKERLREDDYVILYYKMKNI